MSRNIIKRIFKGDTVTWILFAVLCAISLVEVFSAASRLTIRYSLWGPLIGHAKFLLLSIFTALVVHNIPSCTIRICFIYGAPYLRNTLRRDKRRCHTMDKYSRAQHTTL